MYDSLSSGAKTLVQSCDTIVSYTLFLLQQVCTLQKFTKTYLALHLDFYTLKTISFIINSTEYMVFKKENTEAYANTMYLIILFFSNNYS